MAWRAKPQSLEELGYDFMSLTLGMPALVEDGAVGGEVTLRKFPNPGRVGRELADEAYREVFVKSYGVIYGQGRRSRVHEPGRRRLLSIPARPEEHRGAPEERRDRREAPQDRCASPLPLSP